MSTLTDKVRALAGASSNPSWWHTHVTELANEIERLEAIAEGRRELGMAAIATAEIIDTEQMAAARADYLASFAEAFILDAFDAGETTRDQLIARARRIREMK